MKRGTPIIEAWSTKEKLCLSSAAMGNGDQNWMSVSRVLKVFGEQDRPSEWYSQKQCALQYEALLNNFSTSKRKKRNEKGVETIDTSRESVVKKLLQERLEELNHLLEEDRKEFMRIKQEKEDIENGKADDRLDAFEREIEEENEREAAKLLMLRQHEERSRLDGGRLTPHSETQVSTDNSLEQPETKVPTSPLLTSLLQSPSHFRGGSIHNLLNPPTPLPRVNDSPTLSRLLESPAKQLEPTVLFPTLVKKEPVEEEPAQPSQPTNSEEVPVPEIVEEQPNEPILVEIKTELPDKNERTNTARLEERKVEIPEDVTSIQMQEVEVEISTVDVEKLPPISVQAEDHEGEKEEQEHSSLNNLQDSDTMEEQHSITELDSQTVNMIVAGTGVISVSHDTSSEHLEEVSSDIQHKDDSEAAESVKEDSLDDVSDDINETIKEVGASVSVTVETDSCQAVEVEALNNVIIGSENPKDNYVVQLLCSTPENIIEEEAKIPEIKQSQKSVNLKEELKSSGVVEIDEEMNIEGAVLEVGGEMVNLGGAVVVEEEVDTTVHEVEVLVSEVNTTPGSSKGLEEEDSTQDEEMVETPESETHEDSQEEEEVPTPKTSSIEENEREDKDDKEEIKPQKDTHSNVAPVPATSIEVKPESPSTTEDDSEGGAKRTTKKRLISGSVCSDSKPSSPACNLLEDSKEYRSWKKSIMLVFNRLATHKYASIFLRPITNEQAPAYDTVIHRPVDLSTIKKRIEAGELRTTVEFQRDLLLMFQNAIMYNNCRTLVYEMASVMQNECMQHIELMVDAMGEGVPWRKDSVNEDKLHTRGRGEAPKRKRTSLEDSKGTAPKRRKDTST